MPENWWRSRDLSCPPTREQLSREGSVESEMSVDLILGWGVGKYPWPGMHFTGILMAGAGVWGRGGRPPRARCQAMGSL